MATAREQRGGVVIATLLPLSVAWGGRREILGLRCIDALRRLCMDASPGLRKHRRDLIPAPGRGHVPLRRFARSTSPWRPRSWPLR